MNANESDLELRRHIVGFETESGQAPGAFLDALKSEPALRARVRDALSTIDIHPSEAQGLGYTRRAHIDVDVFLECVGIHPSTISDSERQEVGTALLSAACQLREGILGKQFDATDFHRLPGTLQYLALLKLTDGTSGAPLYPSQLQVGGPTRRVFKDFAKNILGDMSSDQAEALADTAAMLGAKDILGAQLTRGSLEGRYLEDPEMKLTGVAVPSRGVYVGDQLEEALGGVSRPNISFVGYFAQTYHERSKEDDETIAGINTVLDNFIILSDVEIKDARYWRQYGLVKWAIGDLFKGHRVGGYSAGMDQLVSWYEPKSDDEYPKAYAKVKELLKGWQDYTETTIDPGAIAQAFHQFSVELIEGAERDIIFKKDVKINDRLSTLGSILKDMNTVRPDLVAQILDTTPMLRKHIERAMDPWGAKYR